MTDLAAIDEADERPPYRQIAAALREAIRRGKLGPATSCRRRVSWSSVTAWLG